MSTKKKAAKKKVVRKKGTKKKLVHKKSGAGPQKVHAVSGSKQWFWRMSLELVEIFFPVHPSRRVVVKFDDTGGLNHEHAHRNTNDTVWFQNLGQIDRKLTLSHWPFLPPAGRILVPAGQTVGPFFLDQQDQFNATVHCHGTPPFPSTGGGPGDPPFDAGD